MRRQARDPLHCAGSLDAPASEDSDTSIGELVADPGAAQDFQNAEDRLYLEQLHDALEKAMDCLPEQQGDTLRRRFYRQQTLDEIAAEEGVSMEAVRLWQMKGLRVLRQQQELQQFVEDRTPYYLRVGVSEFQRTGESAVERIVIRRERLIEQRAERPKLDLCDRRIVAYVLSEKMTIRSYSKPLTKRLRPIQTPIRCSTVTEVSNTPTGPFTTSCSKPE